MKNLFDETAKFSMSGDDDYDEYEEEVIERDEEYDDEDDDEEEYDDEYDEDEEYDDEDYDDEDYDEEYDDGYDDQYYDDRLNQVLDELAELKRTVTAPPATLQNVPQQPYPMVQPHVLFSIPTQQSNEVVMYNEISRLRDELSKTQNQQSLHEELSRLKEDMERDKRQNEAQFLAEIKRLNERIEELQGGGSRNSNNNLPGPNSAPPALAEPPRMPAKELNKLITINESLLHSMNDSDTKIASEIAELKAKLEALNTEGLTAAVEEIKTTVKSLEARPVLENEKEQIAEQVTEKVSEQVPEKVADRVSTLLGSVTEGVDAIRTAISEGNSSSGCALDKKLIAKLGRLNSDGAEVDLTEVMRSVYELKGMLGSNDSTQQNLVNMALKAYTELDLLHATVANSPDFRSKLEAVDNFVNTINEQDFITADALSAFHVVVKDVLNAPLDRKSFDAICSYAATKGKITIPNSRKEAISRYISFAERTKSEDLDAIVEFIPEMISALNDAESGKNSVGNESILDGILELDVERKAASTESERRNAENEIKNYISDITNLAVGDVISFSPTMPLPTSDAITFTEGDSVSDRLNSLIGAVSDLSLAVASGSVAAPQNEEISATSDSSPIILGGESNASDDIVAGLEQLKTMLVALEAKVDLDGVIDTVQRNLSDISSRLSAIESGMSGSVARESVSEDTVPVYDDASANENFVTTDVKVDLADDLAAQATDIVDRLSAKIDLLSDDESRQTVLSDLAEIKNKLEEHDLFISQIGDLRADILSLPEAIKADGNDGESEDQFDKLYGDISEQIASQCDKLYEDLTAVDGEANEKLAARIEEIKAAVESISGADLTSALLDSIVDFRSAYDDARALSEADRRKLLEDVAFVREQAEKRLEEGFAGLTGEELDVRVEDLKNSFAENIALLEEKIAGLDLTPLTATEQQILEGQAEILAAIDELKEKSSVLEDTINNNGILVADNNNAIVEDLNRIIEQLTPPATEDGNISSNVYDEIVAISDKIDELNSVYEKANGDMLASLADIKEQIHLKELEQGIEAVSATEEEQQALLTEIAALRERLSGIEAAQKDQADQTSAQLGLVIDQVNLLSETVSAPADEELRAAVGEIAANENAVAENVRQLLETVAEIKASLGSESNAGENYAEDDLKVILEDLGEIKDKLLGGEPVDGDETASDIRALVNDVAEIKDRLNAAEAGDIVRIQDDLTFIRNQIEANMDGDELGDEIDETLRNEDISLIMDDIVTIKEKLATLDEYDTVAEILSLREDVKAARILDTNDIVAELEALKGDLMELKSDISEIKSLKADTESIMAAGDGNPTSDEVNMLLTEIVSLRDEIQDYKDDVSNIITTEREQEVQPTIAVADENIAVILDELAGLHGEIADFKEENLSEKAAEAEEIKSSLAELKDMISRRTNIADDGAVRETAVSSELNVVLDEVINVKDEVAALKADLVAAGENEAAERESDALSAKSMFADELQVFKNELYSMVSQKLEELSSISVEPHAAPVADDGVAAQLESIKEQLADLQALTATAPAPEVAPIDDSIRDELAEIKKLLTANAREEAHSDGEAMQDIRAELRAMRADFENMQNARPEVANADTVTVDLSSVNEQIAALREQIASAQAANSEAQTDEAVLEELLALRDEVTELRAELEAAAAPAPADESVLSEVLALREEIASLKEQMANTPARDEYAGNETVLEEILSLRDEIHGLYAGASDTDSGLIETVGAIREDVRSMKEEPDLSFINEVLALRDEFQAFKDELNKSRTAPAEDKSKDELIAEVQSLRDQLFAISMANVNDGRSGEEVYESYNNIILDEISALRDEIALIKQSDDTSSLYEELSAMKDKLTNLAVDDSEKTEARFEEIREQIASLKLNDEPDAKVAAVLEEIAELKGEIARQREADAVTANYLSELAKLLDGRDSSADDSDRVAEELTSLKRELSEMIANLSSKHDDESILEEISELRDAIGRSLGEPAVIDNSAILEEISALREDLTASPKGASADNGAVLAELASLKKELSKQNPSEENKKILREISRLKDEIGAMVEKPSDDGVLSQSINDLKAELSQLAGFVDETPSAEPSPAKPKKSSAPRKNAKGGNKKKSAPKATEATGAELSSDELISKIDSVSEGIGGLDTRTVVLDPNAPIPPTSEEMDIASRLAKQVANKLIMEQLVQQLGDGDVPHSEVEEIVRDILPQEFTTIQIDEQSDKVRRLANSLVLDKLRSRLKK